jgi:hypothetical protein
MEIAGLPRGAPSNAIHHTRDTRTIDPTRSQQWSRERIELPVRVASVDGLARTELPRF